MHLSSASTPRQAILNRLPIISAFLSFALVCHMSHLQISSLPHSHPLSIHITPAFSSLSAVFLSLPEAKAPALPGFL